jgi:hypothetical protein
LKGDIDMNKLFKNPTAGATPLSPRTVLENQYRTARMNLLIAILFTLINIVILFTNGGSYFLFSISIPYILAIVGADLCGMMPPEYYEGAEYVEFLDPSFLVVMLVLAAVILALYVLCFFMSKKHKSGWFVFALVMFCIDTAAMVALMGIGNSVVDLIFHIFVIVYLVMGIRVPNKLKALDEQEAAAEAAAAAAAAEQAAGEEMADQTATSTTAEELPDAWAQLNERTENGASSADETNE